MASSIQISKEDKKKFDVVCAILGINKNIVTKNLFKYAFSKPEAFGATPPVKKQIMRALEDMDG